MVLRILNPGDWKCVEPGGQLTIGGEVERLIKIEFNCDDFTRIDLVGTDGVPTFIGVIQGLDKVEVQVKPGQSFSFVSASGTGEVWYFTNEAVTDNPPSDDQTFTQLLRRRSRSDHLEEMMRLQQESYERKIRAQQVEIDAREKASAATNEPGAVSTEPTIQPEPPASEGDQGSGQGSGEAGADGGVSS